MENQSNTTAAYDLVFDVSNMFHRSFGIYNHQIPDFNLDNQKHANMLVRKFVVDFISIARLVNTSNMYFCFDSAPGSFRKLVDTGYKASRKPKPDSFHATLQRIYDLLVFKGLNAIKIDYLEADDLIALVVERNQHIPKILVSSDDDIKQLTQVRTMVLVPHSKQRRLVKCPYSVHPPVIKDTPVENILVQYLLAEKLIKGCDGDDVPPLAPKGYRTKKINDIADNYMRQKMNHNDTELNSWYHAIQLSDLNHLTKEDIQRQLELVCLQSQFMPPHLVEQFNQIKFSNLRITDFSVESILRNTMYWDSEKYPILAKNANKDEEKE